MKLTLRHDVPLYFRKMFIGGLNWETTDQSLRDYFSTFGEVVECTVMRDGATGRSRGFGFLTFKDPKTVNIVMVKEHYLDGKIVRLCSPLFLPCWSFVRDILTGDGEKRSIPSAPSPVMSRKRQARFSLEALVRKPRIMSSGSILPSLAGWWTPR